jgi:hypothetical protein
MRIASDALTRGHGKNIDTWQVLSSHVQLLLHSLERMQKKILFYVKFDNCYLHVFDASSERKRTRSSCGVSQTYFNKEDLTEVSSNQIAPNL